MIYPERLLRCYMLGHHLRYHQRTLWFLMQPCKVFQRFANLLQYFLLKSSLVLLKHTQWPLHDILLHGIPTCQTITCVTGSTIYGFSCRLCKNCSRPLWSTGRLSTLLARFKLVPDSIVCCVRRRANTTMLAFGVGHSTHTANNKIWYKLKQ